MASTMYEAFKRAVPPEHQPQATDPRLIGAYCAEGTKAVTDFFRLELTKAVLRGESGRKEKAELEFWEAIIEREFPCTNPDEET